jgi:hypothetical protein
VIEAKGVFCSVYSDRASHFFVPLKGQRGRVDHTKVTQVGRALQELGVKMIPAYSPQARGRSERNFRTWQGRLPQELRVRGITDPEKANEFLRGGYIAEFNDKFTVPRRRKAPHSCGRGAGTSIGSSVRSTIARSTTTTS